MKTVCCCVVGMATLLSNLLSAAEPGRCDDLVARASEVDPVAAEHPEVRSHSGVIPDSNMPPQSAPSAVNIRDERQLEGWRLLISRRLLTEHAEATEKAIGLLAKQLQEIVRVVPAAAVAKLKAVPLYLSPAYDGFGAKAEYHPAAGWLREHGRDPVMAKAVEFTNILIFEEETRRMPNFALHELAHAYHDRELVNGFGNAEVIEVFQRAQASGRYDKVERQDARGRRTIDRAYALTNPQEYFAETTEAYFSRNDFFPFCREELEAHDPHGCRLLGQLWGSAK